MGDYSPRTERILPTRNAFGKRLFSRPFGAVDAETVPLCLERADAEMLFDDRLILEESIGDKPKFAA